MKRQWTEEENKIIRKFFPMIWDGKITLQDIVKVLPHRSEVAIQRQAERLGLKCSAEKYINQEELKNLLKITKGV